MKFFQIFLILHLVCCIHQAQRREKSGKDNIYTCDSNKVYNTVQAAKECEITVKTSGWVRFASYRKAKWRGMPPAIDLRTGCRLLNRTIS